MDDVALELGGGYNRAVAEFKVFYEEASAVEVGMTADAGELLVDLVVLVQSVAMNAYDVVSEDIPARCDASVRIQS